MTLLFPRLVQNNTVGFYYFARPKTKIKLISISETRRQLDMHGAAEMSQSERSSFITSWRRQALLALTSKSMLTGANYWCLRAPSVNSASRFS